VCFILEIISSEDRKTTFGGYLRWPCQPSWGLHKKGLWVRGSVQINTIDCQRGKCTFLEREMFWNSIVCFTPEIASFELLLNKWIQRPCDWEMSSPGFSRPGNVRQTCVALHPYLGFFHSRELVYAVISPWLWPTSVANSTSSFLSRSVLICPSPGAPQDSTLYSSFFWGKINTP
jgi:hypothetical protein